MAVSKQTTKWTTKDGTKVRICDMANSHLLNTIAMLDRQGTTLKAEETHAAYSALAGLQGEMAQYYCERDIEILEELSTSEWLERTWPIYKKLTDEARKRGLIH